VVIVAGFCLVAYLFSAAPEAAPTQLPLILAGIGGLVAVLAKLGETDSRLDGAAAISKSNATSLKQQAQQIAENTAVTETTHQIVNKERSEMTALITKLRDEVAALRQERTSTATAQSHADQTEARIIAAVEAGPTQATGRGMPPPESA
jgi:hypothetical protein